MSIVTIATQVLQPNDHILPFVHLLNQLFVCTKLIVALFGSITILIGASLAAYRYTFFRLGSSKFSLHDIRLDLAKTIILSKL